MIKYDPILKQVFSIPEMVELLVRRRHPGLADEIDFSTLDPRPTDLVSDQLDSRRPDLLFVADRRGMREILIHLEFQATVDPGMALRCKAYVSLAIQKLREERAELRRPGVLAAVSIVLYHGKRQWTAPLDVDEDVPGFTKPVELLQPEAIDPDLVEPEHAPGIVLGLLAPDQGDGERSRRYATLIRALHQGGGQRRIQRLFRILSRALVLGSEYEHVSLEEEVPVPDLIEAIREAHRASMRVARREGRQEGRHEGRQEGRQEASVQLIASLAGRRFGTETAQRVSRLLAGVTDPERMERVALAVFECADGREFLADVRPLLESGQA